MKSALSEDHFHNEEAAFAYVEKRLWPDGPVCKHCGGTERIGALKGKTTRPGLYKCYVCRKPFTVRMGTVFESSHVPLRFWLQAIYLMTSSKKGISTRQLQRTFGGSMTTSWFLSHRIREAMKIIGLDSPMGGEAAPGPKPILPTRAGKFASLRRQRRELSDAVQLALLCRADLDLAHQSVWIELALWPPDAGLEGADASTFGTTLDQVHDRMLMSVAPTLRHILLLTYEGR